MSLNLRNIQFDIMTVLSSHSISQLQEQVRGCGSSGGGAISSREDLFEDIKKQAASLNERKDAAMKEAQEAILGKLK